MDTRNEESLWKELEKDDSTPEVEQKTKEAVGRPTKLQLPEGQKTGIISVFYGKNRKERRAWSRSRVREKSPETFHPHSKEERKKAYFKRKQFNLLKTN